jgi:hypothetical protein
MKRILIVSIILLFSKLFGQNMNEFPIGEWYVGSECIKKNVGAWATNPLGSTTFCFSKIKSTTILNPMTFSDLHPQYIENVVWNFHLGNKTNRLTCEYLKDLVTKSVTGNGKLLKLETVKDISFKYKYYWTYDMNSEILKIYKNKRLTNLLVEFKVENLSPLFLTKI